MNEYINDLSNKQNANVRAPASGDINVCSVYEAYIRFIIYLKNK